MTLGRLLFAGLVGALLIAFAAPVQAQQMVYRPNTPAQGGNPIQYQVQMQMAQAQNDFEGQRAPTVRDPLQDFEQGLQRQILSALSRELIGTRFRDVDLSQEGRFDFGDFIVEITPGLNDITIRIFNLLTGDESVVTIPGF
jgi:curli production assembly/transport component CsgF